MHRRRFLELAAIAGVSPLAPVLGATSGKTINDVTQLNPVIVADERKPRSADDIRTALDRKSTRLNSSHIPLSRMPSSA